MTESGQVPHDLYGHDGRSELLTLLPSHPITLLDVGCGYGGFGQTLARERPDIRAVALELDASALRRGGGGHLPRRRYGWRIRRALLHRRVGAPSGLSARMSQVSWNLGGDTRSTLRGGSDRFESLGRRVWVCVAV